MSHRWKTLAVVGSVCAAFWVGWFTKQPPRSAKQLPPHLTPTEFRLSTPNGPRKLQVRESDPSDPDRLWVVYVVTPDTTRAYVCEPVE